MNTNSLSNLLDRCNTNSSNNSNGTSVNIDNTGVSDGDILIWNATNNQYEPNDLNATGGLNQQTERTTLTTNRTLTNTDKGILNIEVNNASFNTLTLPASPNIDRRFIIRNRLTSTFDLIITGQDILPPGALWEAVYDGVEWIVI